MLKTGTNGMVRMAAVLIKAHRCKLRSTPVSRSNMPAEWPRAQHLVHLCNNINLRLYHRRRKFRVKIFGKLDTCDKFNRMALIQNSRNSQVVGFATPLLGMGKRRTNNTDHPSRTTKCAFEGLGSLFVEPQQGPPPSCCAPHTEVADGG